MGDPLVCPAQAIYKVWFERNLVTTHTWPASGNQVPAGAGGGNKKRQEAVCKPGQTGTLPATGSNTAGTKPTGSGTGTAGTNPTGTGTGTAGTIPPGTNTGGTKPTATTTKSTSGTGPITTAHPTGTGTKTGPSSTVKPPVSPSNHPNVLGQNSPAIDLLE